MRLLNLGCGTRFHSAWTNVDLRKIEGVIYHDLRAPLPFDDNSFDAVYHSHVLEHFQRAEATSFIKECHRVLRHGGTLRVAVPDLESIAANYLQAIDRIEQNDRLAALDHEWMVLELYDQTVRSHSGGEMAQFLRSQPQNRDFVITRIGVEGQRIMDLPPKACGLPTPAAPRVLDTFRRTSRRIGQLFASDRWRIRALRLLLGDEWDAYQTCRFRSQGEIHQWMYDRISLARLLRDCGFANTEVQAAQESHISNWASYNLDTEPNGQVYKPDSLYMEAIKSKP